MRRILAATLMLGALAALAGCGSSNAPTIQIRHQHTFQVRYGGPPPGSPIVGDVLFASQGKWSGNPTGFAYLWLGCDSNGANCTTAAGSPTNTKRYVIASGDAGDTIRVKVTASYAGQADSSVMSQPTGVVSTAGTTPSNTTAPAVIDTTLINNYEQLDTVSTSAGTWTNSPTSYTYQFQRCTGISGGSGTGCTNIGGGPQCSATSATNCSYTLASGDVGDYIVASVTATNASGSGTAPSTAHGTVVASRVNQPCTTTAALTTWGNQTGANLCGWPDPTNVGYSNAPGFQGESTGGVYPVNPTPGSLTTATAGSSTCPNAGTGMSSNHTYSFCKFPCIDLPSSLTNVTFYADEFACTTPQGWNLKGFSGDNNITWDYATFQPNMAYPGAASTCSTFTACTNITCSQSYEYGIYDENGAMTGYTVEHSWFWGGGNYIDTAGSTQTNPQTFKYNLFTDAVTDGACGYHTDGIGNLNSGTENYATVDHNNFSFTGNTNEIAWQQGNYSHVTNTNNLMDGDNASYAGARTGTGFSADNITTQGNTFDAFMPHATGNYPTDLTGSYWTTTGSTWSHNYWMVPPGSSTITAAGASSGSPGPQNGKFILPNNHSSGFPNDCGWTSSTDYPNTTTDC